MPSFIVDLFERKKNARSDYFLSSPGGAGKIDSHFIMQLPFFSQKMLIDVIILYFIVTFYLIFEFRILHSHLTPDRNKESTNRDQQKQLMISYLVDQGHGCTIEIRG